MNAAMRKQYRDALKNAQAELADHEQRGQALKQAIEALEALLGVSGSSKKATVRKPRRTRERRGRGDDAPKIRRGTYTGLGPSAAYEKFKKAHGDNYRAGSIADALMHGGVKSKSKQSVLTAVHTVRRRERLAREAENKAAEAEKKAPPAEEVQSPTPSRVHYMQPGS